VEGDRSSGAVKLAKQASEQGKDLYVVPANVDTARSSGTNDLLCAGLATPVLSPEDLLRRYDYLLPRSAPAADAPRWRVVRVEGGKDSAPSEPASRPCEASCAPVREEKGVDTAPNTGYIELLDSDRRWNEDERALLKALLSGPATAEALISATGLSASAAGASLVMLAVSGAVEEIPGGQYRIRPEGLS
jgi:DNA processing protein